MGRNQPQGQKSGIRAASVASLFAVAVLALASVDLVLSLITPLTADLGPTRSQQADATIDADLSVLTRQNIFEGAPESEGVLIPEDDLPVTTLQLKLKSAVPGEGTESLAIIELPSSKQELFTEGDTIMRGVRLERVELYRVVISRNGVQEALLLENRPERASDIPVSEGIVVEAQGDAEPDEDNPPPPLPETVVQVQEAIKEGATLADLAGPAFRVLQQSGAEPGDIPVAINGQDVESVSASWSAIFRKAQQDGSLILTVRRNGALENIIVEMPDGINF